MTKKLKIYQILTFALGLAFVGLCLFVGITAVQKSMKLNMSFQINPSVLVKIEAKGSGEAGYTTIFQNSGETTIKNGVNLSGNTLSFGTDYANGLGTSFSLKITNLTSCRVMAELSGASFSKSNLAFASVGSAAQEVTVSAVNGLTMNFSQVFAISKGSITNATITPKSNVYTIDDTYYVKQNTEPSFTLTGSGNYATPAQGAIGLTSGSIKSYSNGTLTFNTLTSDTTITINNTTGKTYTVTKGTITGFAWGTVASNATFNTDYTFTLVLQDGYKIDGATVQAVIGGNTYNCSQTAASGTTYTFKLAGASITGNVTINAVAEALLYTIGTYGVDVILGTDTIVTETGYNGYKYVEFNEVKSWTNDEGYTVPLRWVIIGAGANQKDLLPSGAANKSANPDNLGADEILVISEQCIEYNVYDIDSADWSVSDIRNRIKSYTETGGFMANLKQYMVPRALTTAWYQGAENNTTEEDPDYMFLIARKDMYVENYADQDFLAENYLGANEYGEPVGDLYVTRYVGNSNEITTWWLRSGYRSLGPAAVCTFGGGPLVSSSDNIAVRPCFVLNLA